MDQQPSIVATGDFLYFAPSGQAFTVPGAGVVSAAAKPGATDPIWTTYALGTTSKATSDKFTGKPVTISAPIPGTGQIAPTTIVRPTLGFTVTAVMNEFSRLAAAGFYRSPLIQPTDTSFTPLSGGPIQGWLKRQRYNQASGLFMVLDFWVDLDCTELTLKEENVIQPQFVFTWLYSGLQGAAI